MDVSGSGGARWRDILDDNSSGAHSDAPDEPVDGVDGSSHSSSSDDGDSSEEGADFADAPRRKRSGRERAGWGLADLQRGMRCALAKKQLSGQQASGEAIATHLQIPQMGRTLRRALTLMWQSMEAFDSEESALVYVQACTCRLGSER